MTTSNPGDPEITTLTVGSINLLTDAVLLSLSVYESIFAPATICDITVLDAKDNIGQKRLVGGEKVVVEFKTDLSGSQPMKLDLVLDQASDTIAMGDQKSKIYTLKCVSPEAIYAKTNYVMKCYKDKLCSDMIKDLATTYLHTKKQIDLEPTKGTQVILIPNMNPYHAISLVKKRSVSSENVSSVFVFYESREGNKQKYKFTTIEKLFKGSAVKQFTQSSTKNTSIGSRTDNNIIAYKINHQADASTTVKNTRSSTVRYELLTHSQQQNAKYVANPGRTGGTISTNPDLTNIINSAKHAPLSYFPSMFGVLPETHQSASNPNFMSYISALMQNSMRIRVPGDTILTAGAIIDCSIPEKQGDPSSGKNEPMLSGNFLISRIHHMIGDITQQPRYTCSIECLKAGYEKG